MLGQTRRLGVGVYTGAQRVVPGVCSLLSSQHPIVLSPVWASANAERVKGDDHMPTVGRSLCDPAGEREALQDWLSAQKRSHPAPNLPASETAKRITVSFHKEWRVWGRSGTEKYSSNPSFHTNVVIELDQNN